MKRKSFITILATLMLLVLAVSAFTACGKKDGDKDKDTTHTHTYATEWSKDATNHWHAATCEHTSEKKDVAAHTFGEWTETKASTYTEKGEKQRACTVCGYVENQDIDALGAQENSIAVKTGVNLGKTYDRTPVAITKDYFAYNGDGEVTIVFKAKDAAVFDTDAPFVPGECVVKVSVSGTSEWESVEKEFDFIISKARINIGRTEFTSSFKNGNWQKNIALTANDGVVKKADDSLEDVKMYITSDTTGWKNGDSFAMYVDTENKENGKVYVELIGDDKNNYEFEDDNGNLDATLNCVAQETEVDAILDPNNGYDWGGLIVDNISFDDKEVVIGGGQGEITDKLIDDENNFKQLKFSVFVKGTTIKIAEGTRILWQGDDCEHVYTGCRLIQNAGGPADFEIDLLKNVEGYTDSNGYWICEQQSVELTLTVEETTDVATINQNLFENGLVSAGYALVKYTHNDDDGSALSVVVTEGTGTIETHVYGFVGSQFKELTLNGGGYDMEDGQTYYIVVFVKAAGTGNAQISVSL